MKPERTYYDVLGISEAAPDAVVRAAHRALMKSLHPDTATGDLAESQAVNQAFKTLSSASSRREYDEELAALRARETTDEPGSPAGPAPDEDDWGEETEWTAPDPSPSPPAAPQPRPEPRPTPKPEPSPTPRPAPTPPPGDRTTPVRRDFATASPAALAGIDVWAREGIDLSSMPWFTRDYGPPRKPRDTRLDRVTALIPRKPRFWAWVCFTLLGVLAVLPVIPMAVDAVQEARLLLDAANAGALDANAPEPFVRAVLGIMAYLFLGPGIALLLGRPRARRRRGSVRYVLYLTAGLGLCLLGARTSGPGSALPLLLLLGLFALTVELFRASRRPFDVRRRLLPRADVGRYNRWGTPGGDLTRTARALPDRARAQLMTGQLIASVLQTIPGTKAVHGLRMPGSDVAVHHAVLCGRRLAVVNSEMWSGGDAFWLQDALMFSQPHRTPTVVPYPFTRAPGAFADVLGRVEVRGWLVLHSGDGRRFQLNNQAAESTRVVTPEDFLREAGEWLSEAHPTQVPRRVLSALVLRHQR